MIKVECSGGELALRGFSGKYERERPVMVQGMVSCWRQLAIYTDFLIALMGHFQKCYYLNFNFHLIGKVDYSPFISVV